MAPKPTAKPGNSGNSGAKLSSGILGMKFMRKDESAKEEDEPSTPDSKTKSNKFEHEADPGEWHFSNNVKQVSHRNHQASFSDIYGSAPTGRLTFGKKPVSKAEEMSTSEPKVKKSKAKKRPSSEDLSGRQSKRRH